MKKEPQSDKKGPLAVYPFVVSVVTAIIAILFAIFAARNLHLSQRVEALDCAIIGFISLVAARLAMSCVKWTNRKIIIGAGVAGMALCAGMCWWVFHTSNFRLTENSYQTLNDAKIPADLIAELKNAEGAAAETEQQFVGDLSARFGQNHIAPYREALIQSGWNIHRRVALAALLGFCVCFSLTAGAALAEARPLTNSPGFRHS